MRRATIAIAILVSILALPVTGLTAQEPPAQELAAGETAKEPTDKQLWFGVLDAGSRKFRFVIELDEASSEDAWAGTLLSLDEGGARFPMSEIIYNDQEFSFEIKVSAGKFEGSVGDNGSEIRGKWKQRGAELDLAFEKVQVIPQEELKALWVGEIKVLFQRLVLTFRELETGEIFFDSTTQKAGGFVATKNLNGDQVEFEVPALKAKFSGKLNEERTEIVGKWTQGLFPVDLTLKESKDAREPAETKPRRPQTPQPPYPYESLDVSIPNPNAQAVTLAGTLTIPIGSEPVPAVILISGSGPQDRDESIKGHKPFWVWADHFSRNGIAVLRFDDRGVGKSQGDFNSATSIDFASDVKAIFEFLAKHERIDAKRIGLCGHSEGGIIAPIVAAEDPRVAFVILLAGTGVTGEAILKSQLKLILRASGVEEVEIKRQSDMQHVYLELSTRTPPISRAAFEREARQRIEPLLSDKEREADAISILVAASAAQMLNPWFRYFLVHDPAENLTQLSCPVLAINGSKDLQVDADLNIPAISEALAKSKTKDFETVVLPDLNHLFQKCKTGNLDEYEEIEETINPAALEIVTNWILAKMK